MKKKILKFFIIVILITAIATGGIYAYEYFSNSNTTSEKKTSVFDTLLKFFGIDTNSLFNTNQESFDETSVYAFKLNQTDLPTYLSTSTLSSRKELEGMYLNAWRNLYQYTDMNIGDMEMYLAFMVDDNPKYKFYIKNTFSFDVKTNNQERNPNDIPNIQLTGIKIDWIMGVDGNKNYIYESMLSMDKEKTAFGVVSRGIKGNSVRLTDESRIIVNIGNKEGVYDKAFDVLKAYKLENNKINDIQEISEEGIITYKKISQYSNQEIFKQCDSFYSDIFETTKLKDETSYALKTIYKPSQVGLESIYNNTYSYDHEQFGDNPLTYIYKKAYQNETLKNEFKELYPEEPIHDSLVFSCNFIDERTASEVVFYLHVSFSYDYSNASNEDVVNYIILYEYVDSKFVEIASYGSAGYNAKDIEYDFTNYRYGGKENTYFVCDDHSNQLLHLFDIGESDFPDEIINNCFLKITIKEE